MKNKKQMFVICILALMLFALCGCQKFSETVNSPISGFNGFWDIFTYPAAAVIYICGLCSKGILEYGYYPLTVFIVAVFVNTLMYVYTSKTNEVSLKINLAQPEIDKIEAKYADRADDESAKMYKNLEIRQVYKKYGIKMSTCLSPILTFLIQIALIITFNRMPASYLEGNWVGSLFSVTDIFGVDLMLRQNQAWSIAGEIVKSSAWTPQRTMVIICIAISLLTAVIVEIIDRVVSAKKSKFSNTASADKNLTKKTTIAMTIILHVLSWIIIWLSPLAWGIFVVLKGVLSIAYRIISIKQNEKRLVKLKAKYGG